MLALKEVASKQSKFQPSSMPMSLGKMGLLHYLKIGKVVVNEPTVIIAKSNPFWYSTVDNPEDRTRCIILKALPVKGGDHPMLLTLPIEELEKAQILEIRDRMIMGKRCEIRRYLIGDEELSDDVRTALSHLLASSLI